MNPSDSLAMNIAKIIAETADSGFRGQVEPPHREAAHKILELLELGDCADFNNQVVLTTHEINNLAKEFNSLPDGLRELIFGVAPP